MAYSSTCPEYKSEKILKIRPDTTRSDLDFQIDTQHPQVNNLIEDINKIGYGSRILWDTEQHLELGKRILEAANY
ncbi:hypothetical protein [Thiothrix eikelboomii]|uniref:hypothetical protein n=1 Tax=Thiothrix eikelboomii TaxID=92487 RepID=UPI00099B4359|nr:hypothetical protein [Thiothrix eikelboomii]